MTHARPTYHGKHIYIGIDVHRKSYTLTCRCDGLVIKRCHMAAEPRALVEFCRKQFPGASVTSAYEAGFSGFGLHRTLCAYDIHNIVVHPASIEVAARDRVKTDKRDSAKIAEQLAAGRLQGIRVPTQEEEQKRLLTRGREQLLCHRTRLQNQLRMRLHQFGLLAPTDTRRMCRDIVTEVLQQPSLSPELHMTIETLSTMWRGIDEQLRHLGAKLREQAKHDPLEQWYRSVPGIGPLAARVLANELGDMRQFTNERALFSFTGLTPSESSSGDARRIGHISRQGAGRLRYVLIESAWVAIRKDPELATAFERIALRAGKKRAIVAIARKLVGRIRAVIRTQQRYEIGKHQAC
jgi:transposase